MYPLTLASPHGKKGFVIPTKSFLKIGMTKILLQQQNVWFYQQIVWLLREIFGSNNKNFIICCP